MTDVIEPIAVPDLFVDRLVRIEHIGPCRRLVFAVPHVDSYGPGDRSLVVTARIVLPAEALPAIVEAPVADQVEAASTRQ
jgi:hypothetical protein